MMYWVTDTLRIRGMTPEDAADNARRREQNDDESDLLCDRIYPPLPREALAASPPDALELPKDDHYRFILENKEGVAVGSMQTHQCDPRNGTFSYGISIAREHRGKGYGREALKRVLNFYFNELRYHKCNIAIYAFNEGSVAFHKRFGFREEGRRRDSLYAQGRFHDILLYGMTRSEFDAAHTVDWR